MVINKQNINLIQKQISNYNKKNKNIIFVAVTKTRTSDEIQQLLSQGIKNIAENKIQEAEIKFIKISSNIITQITKHFIGKLQSNKIKKIVQLFEVIQSVDSLKLVELIDKEAQKSGKIQQIMIQINIGNEQQKGGVVIEKVFNLFEKIVYFQNLKIIGIMCIAPDINIYGEQKVRDCFREMKNIFDKLNKDYNAQLKHLSMGMSDDYIIALQEGSNMVRIGRLLFE